jgi:hypothetical protein
LRKIKIRTLRFWFVWLKAFRVQARFRFFRALSWQQYGVLPQGAQARLKTLQNICGRAEYLNLYSEVPPIYRGRALRNLAESPAPSHKPVSFFKNRYIFLYAIIIAEKFVKI